MSDILTSANLKAWSKVAKRRKYGRELSDLLKEGGDTIVRLLVKQDKDKERLFYWKLAFWLFLCSYIAGAFTGVYG